MLEDRIDALISALNANTEALGGKSPGKTTPAAAAAKAPAAAKVTAEMVKAALVGVRDAHGKAAALKIIKEDGNAAEMAAIKPARYSAVVAACEELMGEGGDDSADEDDNNL